MPFAVSSTGLLDTLAGRMDCLCLSDLGISALRSRLIRTLAGLKAEEFPLSEWREAVSYLLRMEPDFSSAEEARTFLLDQLRKKK